MLSRFRRNVYSHIPYSPAEELSDEQLHVEIQSMENASDILPRRRALREERIARHISDIGLSKAEELLGITPKQEGIDG